MYKRIIKYIMKINGDDYKALFVNHLEAHNFIKDCEADGDIITDLDYITYSAKAMMADKDFEEIYKIEMLGTLIFEDDIKNFHKVSEIEKALKAQGYL